MALQTVTLRPAADVSNAAGFTVTGGGGTVSGATGDNSDASYISKTLPNQTGTGYAVITLAALPAAVGTITRVRCNIRGKISDTSLNNHVIVSGAASSATVSATSITTVTGAWTSSAGIGDLSQNVSLSGSADDFNSATYTIYDVWVDVEYDDSPDTLQPRAG